MKNYQVKNQPNKILNGEKYCLKKQNFVELKRQIKKSLKNNIV